MIAWSLATFLVKWPYWKIGIGVCAVIVAYGTWICAWRQTGYWNDSFTLF